VSLSTPKRSGSFGRYCGRKRRESRDARGSLVSDCLNPLERKLDAGNPHVQFDERGVEIECMAGYSGTGNRKGRSRLWPVLHAPTPLLDSTRGKLAGSKGN